MYTNSSNMKLYVYRTEKQQPTSEKRNYLIRRKGNDIYDPIISNSLIYQLKCAIELQN